MVINILCFLAGGVVVGFIANRRPQWFSKAVTLVNAADDQANAAIAKAKGP